MNIGDLAVELRFYGSVGWDVLFGLLYRVIYDYFLTTPTTGSVFIYTILLARLINIEERGGDIFTGLSCNHRHPIANPRYCTGLGETNVRSPHGGKFHV